MQVNWKRWVVRLAVAAAWGLFGGYAVGIVRDDQSAALAIAAFFIVCFCIRGIYDTLNYLEN